ncbi:MAG: hypothetical protein WC099_03185 [Candidatus Paceibacterota bacterium]
MSLEDLEKELYGQRSPKQSKPKLPSQDEGIATYHKSRFDPWDTEEKEKSKQEEKLSMPTETTPKAGIVGRGILLGGISILIVLMGFAVYYLYQYFTTKDIVLTISVPNQISVGEPFTTTLSFENISTKKLIAPKISLALPEGVVFVDAPDKRIQEEDIHDIDPQETIRMEYALLVTGKPQQTYELEGGVSYGYESSSLSSRFDKGVVSSVVVGDTVFGLEVTAPDKTINGEEFDMNVRYQNTSDHDIARTTISFVFPKGFIVTGSSVPLNKDNTVDVDVIPAHDEGMVVVSGYMVGDEYSYFTTQIDARAQIGTIRVPLVSKTISISILPSPLSVTLSRDKATYPDVVYVGNRIMYQMKVENTGDVSLIDAIAEMILDNPLFDTNSLQGTGYFNEQTKTYTWTAAQVGALKEIMPHTSFSIPLSVSLKEVAAQDVLQQKSVRVRARVTSPTVSPFISAKETIGISQIESMVGGLLGFSQGAYFKEPTSDITNEGSLPPRVGSTIQYTIHWKLNGMGDFTNSTVQATLSPGVSWTGKLKVIGTDSVPTYNNRTQEILWHIPMLTATSMASTTPEAIFQVMFTPTSQNSGNIFEIISDAQVSSTEVVSQKQIQSSAKNITSRQLQDTKLPEGYYRVLPVSQ